MKRLASEFPNQPYVDTLHQLERITCVGDTHVFRFVRDLMDKGGAASASLYYFLQNIPDPAIFPLLKNYYEKTGDATVLVVIGRQGSPEAIPFLRDVAAKIVVTDERSRSILYAACGSLMSLYLSLERRGMSEGCEKAREVIFDLYDHNESFKDWANSHPEVLGQIPHEGAVSRLEGLLQRCRAHGIHKYHREYVASVLERCRLKIANTR